jgi:hypothetical protein
MLFSNALNGIALSIFYGWKDGPAESGNSYGILRYGEEGTGVDSRTAADNANVTVKPKPSYTAAAVLNQALEGYLPLEERPTRWFTPGTNSRWGSK